MKNSTTMDTNSLCIKLSKKAEKISCYQRRYPNFNRKFQNIKNNPRNLSNKRPNLYLNAFSFWKILNIVNK